MSADSKKSMSRKDFIKKTSGGIIGATLLGSTAVSGQNSAAENSKLRVLGNTGIKVHPIGFGASRTMEEVLVKMVIERGANFFDTGRNYFNGQNEVMLGKAIKGKRKDLIIQSKVSLRMPRGVADMAAADLAKRIELTLSRSLNQSLEALQTDYIDIFLMHGLSSADFLFNDTVIKFFNGMKKRGTIRAAGFTSHSNQVKLLEEARKAEFVDVVMVPHNHKGAYVHSNSGSKSEWDKDALEVELKAAKDKGLAVIAMKTCSGGPYPASAGEKPSFKGAIKWLLEQNLTPALAVAMASQEQIEEDFSALA